MLLILMYHQIIDPNLDPEISVKKFEKHLNYLQEKFNIIVPGQTIFKNKSSVCLTFDDAYADLYYYIFPLLKKLAIPAVLAIPAGLIEDSTNLLIENRMLACYPEGITEKPAVNSPLCSWPEIRTMVRSGLIYPASHSLNHKNLKQINAEDTYQEICKSKRIISVKLETIPEIFIYPFGAYNNKIQTLVKDHYKYAMRIGGAGNSNWNQNILYRINADYFWKNEKKIFISNIINWKVKYLINRIKEKLK